MTGSTLHPVAGIIGAKRRMSLHWVASARTESKLKIAFVSASALALWFGAFALTRVGLRLLERFGAAFFGANDSGLIDVLLTRMLSVAAVAVFFLLLTSNVLVSFATIYRAKEVAYLVQSPISRAEFFLARFWECCWMSSWALAFIGSPVLLAYGLHRGVPVGFYIALAALYPAFVAIPAAIGAGITVVLVRLFATRRRPGILALGAIGIGTLFLLFRSRGALPDLSEAESTQALMALLGRADLPWMPSYWLSEGLLAAAIGDYPRLALFFGVLLANAVFAVWVATLLAERWFYPGWTALLGSDQAREARSSVRLFRGIDSLLRPLREPTRSLIAKDIRLFWRDPAQWSQFLIFFGLMALYVANMRRDGGILADERFRSWIAILNMAASMLVLATLTTRFVFPLISLEGRRFWILGLAPLQLRTLVRQKLGLSLVTCSSFTVALSVLTAHRLDLSGFEVAVTLGGVLSATVALSGLAVGLGCLYPNFREDNPSRIISGLGGTLNFILSLVFIVAVVVIQTTLLLWSGVDVPIESKRLMLILATVLLALLTTVAAYVPLRLGLRNLRSLDF